MTNEEAIARIKIHKSVHKMNEPRAIHISEALEMAIKLLAQEPCEDAISRQAVINALCDGCELFKSGEQTCRSKCEEYHFLATLPSVTPQPKTGHCKDCKYFEHDSVAKVDGIPLIVAHEICSRWGNGCKTREGGYCFLFEPQESEE